MSMPKTLIAYGDIQDTLDRALSAPKGVSISFPTYGAAVHFRQRIYSYRKLLRDESLKVYESTSPEYGRSVYDSLVITTPARTEPTALEIRKSEFKLMEVKDL